MSSHRMEPGMLWQSYRAALTRNEYETAVHRLHAYLKQQVTRENAVATALPLLMSCAQEYQLYGIDVLSKAFDEYSPHGWVLSQQPVDLLNILQQHHMSSIIEQFKAGNDDPEVCNRAVVLIQYLCGLVSSVSNYTTIMSNGVTSSVLSLAQSCLHIVMSCDAATPPADLLTIISHCIIYFHLYYDPNRKWKSQFVQQLANQLVTAVKVSLLDGNLSDFFIRLFDSMGGAGEGVASEDMMKIQYEMLHMFGAVMAGSKRNARMLLNGKTCALLFTLFRDIPTIREAMFTRVQAIGARVIARAVVVAYNWRSQVADLEQPVTVDLHVLLYGIMHSLDPCKNKETSDSNIPLSAIDIVQVCLLLDTMSMITDHRSHSRRRLQEQLINAKCFTSIMSSMATIAETNSQQNNEEGSKALEQLCCSCLRAMTAILKDNSNAKDVFASVVGYCQLAATVRKLCPINQIILKEFLAMSFDGYIAEQMVFNAHALAVLQDCFYHLSSADQLWSLDKLLDIVKRSVHNQQKCCQGGLIGHLLSLLAQHHRGDQQLSKEATGKLIELLEVLASHSISSVELKMFLHLLMPNKEGQLPTHAYVLQKTLLNMTLKDTRNLPLNTIDLTTMESEIKLEKPVNMKSVGGGFTFHAWIYLSPPLSMETPGALRKRMIYYFGVPNGAGFQAFFRNSGTLVIATVTKRGEFISLCLQDCPLTHSAWHSICIVHVLTHRLWSHSEVSVFIDGRLIRTEKMKGPESQEYPEAYIGCGPPIKGENEEDIRMEELLYNITGEMHDIEDSISESYALNLSPALPVETKSIQSAKEQYGVEGILRGFLCSACLFSECLTTPMIASMVDKGPNDFSLFQPRKANSLHEVASKLMFYYHAKACHDNGCPDLSPLHIPGSTLDASIHAPVYSSWEVKSVLRSLGGAKLLIPLLENAGLPVSSETDSSVGVSLFLQLLHAFLDEHNQNLFMLNDGIAVVGALMEEVPADKLTVGTLNAVQSLLELAESSVHRNFVMDIYRHLIFNFYIWSRADYSVQSGHVQFVSTIVKDNLGLCSKDYGVQFMLNIIQSFYCTGCKEPSCLEDGQQRSIAAALFSNIKLYLQKGIRTEDVKALLAVVLSTESFSIQEEILRLLLHMLKTSDHASVLGHSLMSEGTPLLALLHSHSNSVSQTVTNIMLNLYKKFSADEGKLSASFKDGTFATAMVQMLRHQDAISSNILLSVLDMCTGKSMENFTDYIVNLELCMALLQLLRIADNQVKTTICQQLISLLQLNPAHAVEIARRPAWEMIFLWLLITDDTPVTTPLGPSHHTDNNENDLKEDASFADGFEVVNLPFSTPTSSDDKKSTADDDKERLLNTIVEVMGLIVWEEAIDVIVTDDMYLKHAWCRLFTAVRDFTDKHHAMFSSRILLQKLLQFVLQIVHMTCSGSGHDTPNFITIVSTVLELFEFYCTSYSSHVPKLNDTICSIQLLECYINLMRTMGLFAGICTDIMIIRFTLRLLVACLTTENKQYSVIGVSRLEELLQCSGQQLQANDVCYLLHVLFSVLQGVRLTGEVESKHYMVLAIKTLFIHSPDSFDTSKLSLFPDPLSNPNFTDDFMAYIPQDEWNHFMASSVIPGSVAFWEEHISPLQARWYDLVKLCGQILEEHDARRLQHVTQQNNKYQEQVLDVFFEKQKAVREQFTGDCFSHYVNKHNIMEQWTEIKRSMTGEQGVWSVEDEVPRQFTLQVDPTENFSRMRMRLTADYTSGRHEDASRMRDEGYSEITTVSTERIEHSLLREARALRHTYSISSDVSEFSFLTIDDELLSSPSKNKSVEEHSEKRIKTVECQFITLVDFTPGMLHITTHNLHFVPESFTAGMKEFKISLKDIREIHSRRYHLVRSALELFLVDQTNYFFNFLSKKASTKVYGCITSLHTPNLIYSGIIQPHKLLQASGLTHKWVRHQISNFDYIMQLNTLSGRTYNDLNQYPVFPWVLCDYDSDNIDLNDPKVYRDLSKPLGIINPSFEPMIRERYEEFEDPSGEIEKFHYGTHYSNAAGVMHYLIRLEPFTSQHISLQSGRFDHSDRQFFSISNTWSAISTSMSDVKELIPEFYYLPEFLINVNNYDLGKLQDKSQIEDVILPKWAKDPYDFVHINRKALESDYVSEHLHEWVDLIWGYKQRGEEAVKACNVFYYCTYEGSVDLTSITNEKKRKQLESMINNFGQTPTQLFFEPHPPRLSLEEARKSLAGKFSASGQKSARSIFENLKELKAFSIEVTIEPLVSVSSPTVKLETIIASGNPEHVLTVTNSGLVNKHDWLPFSHSRNKSFTFTLDHNMHLDRSQWQFLGAPFSSSVPITDNLFVSSACNNLLVSAGHWDCSFRVHNLVKGKTVRRISHHTDIVTCLALDKPGERLITGSRDTTCAIWQFSSQHHSCAKPLQILYGHNAEIMCVDASVELDTVVSGAKDGACIIHSLRKGGYMHSLQANHKVPSKVTHIAISPSSARIVACYQLMQEKRQKLTWLHLFTINGQLLKTLEVEQTITGLIVTDNHFITSSIEMKLIFGHLHNLKQVSSLKLQSPVYSLSLTYQSTHLLVGLADGKLVIVTCIK